MIADGGTGSELQRRGVPIDPVCWNAGAALHHYPTLVSVHVEHVLAGAEIITTNTFATHRYVLAAAGFGDLYRQVNEAAVAAARRARTETGRPVAIAGSMSCLPPAFDTSRYPDAASERAAYVEQAETLAELGVDLLALEMMQDTEHAALAMQAALATGLPVWLGVSCRLSPGPEQRLVGFDFPDRRFEAVLAALTVLEPDLVNIMHTPLDAVPAAIAALGEYWSGPVGVAPELGSFDPVTRTRSEPQSPEAFAAAAEQWTAQGVRVIGGCCGARPVHIAALTARIGRSARGAQRES